MKDATLELEERFARDLRRHLEAGSEETLHSAYEAGRGAIEQGLGVLETGGALMRAVLSVPRADRGAIESFVTEAMLPFEMAHRGAREANLALRRIDEVREAEARRLARELHDEAGQLFAAVQLALDELSVRVGARSEAELDRVRVMLARAEERLRRLAHELRPAMLDDLGLRAALDHLAEYVGRRSGMHVAIVGDTTGRLSPQIETALYRAVQEALTNTAKHARASAAIVRLAEEDGTFTCSVEDNGAGFDAGEWAASRDRASLGLKGIRERLAVVRGVLDVRSTPGRGTQLILSIPMEVSHVASDPDRR